jgi:hypothetical protein
MQPNITPAFSWMATSRAAVNGSQEKKNNVADALSQDWHRDDKELTSILRHHFPLQMPKHFVISQIPSKINSWLTLLLQRLPMREQLREQHTTMQLKPGGDGPNIARPSHATISIWTDSADKSKYSSSGLLAWLSVEDDSCHHGMTHWCVCVCFWPPVTNGLL